MQHIAQCGLCAAWGTQSSFMENMLIKTCNDRHNSPIFRMVIKRLIISAFSIIKNVAFFMNGLGTSMKGAGRGWARGCPLALLAGVPGAFPPRLCETAAQMLWRGPWFSSGCEGWSSLRLGTEKMEEAREKSAVRA